MEKYIKALPKAELHLHIEGSLEPELMFELSKKNKVSLPYDSAEQVREAYNFSNLQSFLDLYYLGASVLVERDDFFRLTWNYLCKVHRQNLRHVELFFDPQTHTHRNIAFETVINGIHDALVKGEKELGISFKIFMCFLRHLDEKDAFETLNQALKYKDKIVGVGLDSAELGNPPEKFTKVFAKAREEGFLTVAHAGEEGPPEYIWQSLDLLQVERIDHGVRSVEDSALMERLVKEQIPLTVCPLSNVKLRVFKTLEEHNLKKLLDRGLMVMINSDDPSYFGGYIEENYIECYRSLNLSKENLKKLAINSFKSSFLEKAEIDRYIKEINEVCAH